MYCSKINKKHYHLIESIDTDTGKTEYEIDYYIGSGDYLDWCFDGKVAFKFRCYKVEEIKADFFINKNGYYGTHLLGEPVLEKTSCLTHKELKEYLRGDENRNDVQNVGCAIHISDLEIFDKPKELSEFYKYMDLAQRSEHMLCMFHKCNVCKKCQLTKAPQSFCYIEVE